MQPSYIPWRGYFDLIRRVDSFVFYDDVQYDRRGWRNRNRIKTPTGTRWLTIPVHARGSQVLKRSISSIRMAEEDWPLAHLNAFKLNYSDAPFFPAMEQWLHDLYAAPPPLLADFTIAVTIQIARKLGIDRTTFVRASEFAVGGTKTERLMEVLKRTGATTYLSGPSARNYLDIAMLEGAGIAVEWIKYDYPEYAQLHPPFDPYVSVLDLLFMTGDAAPRYIWPAD